MNAGQFAITFATLMIEQSNSNLQMKFKFGKIVNNSSRKMVFRRFLFDSCSVYEDLVTEI